MRPLPPIIERLPRHECHAHLNLSPPGTAYKALSLGPPRLHTLGPVPLLVHYLSTSCPLPLLFRCLSCFAASSLLAVGDETLQVSRVLTWLAMSPTDPLDIAAGLLAQPTVPFLEDLPAEWITRFATERGLHTHRDRAGNVVVTHNGAKTVTSHRPPLVLVAHLDHPGFVFEGDTTVGPRETVSLTFRGGLTAGHVMAGTTLAFFRRGDPDRVGTGAIITADADPHGRLAGATAEVVSGEIGVDHFAMWDFPENAPAGVIIDDARITARACDDLLGAAAILAALDTVAAASPPDISVIGLFTRAEEVGFLGALEAIRLGTVPAGALVLSLECSKALVSAPQGEGVIVRVGDRLSVFDPLLTESLRTASEQLGVDQSVAGFGYQRKLMDGGACEASAFCAAGYRASGLALPLGNYHNAHDGDPGIAAEHVLIADFLSEVGLLTRLTADSAFIEAADDIAPPAWLSERMATARLALGADGTAP